MKTVTFKQIKNMGGLYFTNETGDQSGEYVRAEDVRELVEALRKLVYDLLKELESK